MTLADPAFKKLNSIFAPAALAGAMMMSGCEHVKITTPLPSYKVVHGTDRSDPLCQIVNTRRFNPGWFLLVKFNFTNNTQIDQTCISEKMAEFLIASDNPVFMTNAVEFYDTTSDINRKIMDDHLQLQGKTIEDIRAVAPQFISTVEHNECLVTSYRMRNRPETAPPASDIDCSANPLQGFSASAPRVP